MPKRTCFEHGKLCARCGEIKPYAEFHIRNRANRKYQSKCKSCCRFMRETAYGDKERIRSRQRWTEIIGEVVTAYGGRCECCGESEPLFLEIDHINGGGRKHTASIGRGKFYRWLKQNNFPKDGLRLLCANCNRGRWRNGGTCPHKEPKSEWRYGLESLLQGTVSPGRMA